MDCSPPGFSVHGISESRILEWVAIYIYIYIYVCMYVCMYVFIHKICKNILKNPKPYLSLFEATSHSLRRRQWHPTPVFLHGKSHGRRSLVGCSPWGLEESDTTEWLHFDFSLSCTGEGNGNPLHCSCLENPREGEPGGLPSMGLHSVGHDSSNLAAATAAGTHTLL